MDFFHANYSAGVQDMSYMLETIDREGDYLLGRVVDSDRFVLIFDLKHNWLNDHFDADMRPDVSLENWCVEKFCEVEQVCS
jgi:hypothetical protein